jgi:iron complex outermembrane recepter protein
MEVLSGEQLAETGQNDVSEILKNISNAVINRTDEGMRVTLRGVNEAGGSFNNMRVQTPTVAINYDGAYNTEDSAGQNLFDIERVEVLYGPQSTMYGSNSPGGIVNIITVSPKTDKYSANGSYEAGSFKLSNANIALNAPIVMDKLAMRLTGQRSKHGSWVKDNNNASTTTNFRLKTLYQPNEDLILTLTGSWAKSTSGGMMGGSVAAFVDEGNIPGGGTAWDYAATGGGGGPPPMPGLPGGSANAADRVTKGLSSEITWNTPFASISIVPAYSRSEMHDTSLLEDVDVNVGGVMQTVDTYRYSENWTKQKNADVRLTSPADFAFKWILGGTYYNSSRENNDIFNEYPDNNQRGYSWQKTKGIYGNITYPFTDTFRGTAGYRYSWDQMYNNESMPKTGTTGVTGMDYSAPDYKIGIEYDLADNTMLFANYATSYRVQSKAAQQTINPDAQKLWRPIPPEELKSYTIGSKSRFLGNKLQVNASAYYYDYRNREFPVAGEWSGIRGTPGGPPVSTVEADYCGRDRNGVVVPGAEGMCPDFDFDGIAGETTSMPPGSGPEDPQGKQVGAYEAYGLDLSTNWMITAADRLDVSISYMHTKWKEAEIHMLWWWIWTDETGELVEGMDFSNMANTYSPTWSGNIGYEHNFLLGNLGTLTPHVDIQFKTEYALNLYSDAQVAGDPSLGPSLVGWNRQEAYYLVDTNINFAHASGKWTLNAYVKNATNYAVKTTLAGGGPTGGSRIGLNDPRTYGAVLSIKF